MGKNFSQKNIPEKMILGLLMHEPLTGYEIKRRCQTGLKYMWNINHSQIYSNLHRIEKEGLVIARKITQEVLPDKIEYSITEKGRNYFKNWLQAHTSISNSMRLETPLRLFFGGVVDTSSNERLLQKFITEEKSKLHIAKAFSNNLKKVRHMNQDHQYYYQTIKLFVEITKTQISWAESVLMDIKE